VTTSSRTTTLKASTTLESIQFAEGVQKAAKGGAPGGSELPRFGKAEWQNIEEFALRARKYFNITSLLKNVTPGDDPAKSDFKLFDVVLAISCKPLQSTTQASMSPYSPS
jgi:hypothetical protein